MTRTLIPNLVSPKLRVRWERLLLTVFALLLWYGQVSLHFKLLALDTAWVEPPLDKSDKMDAAVFRSITVGHLPAALDWLWMNVLTDSAINKVTPGSHPGAYYDLDLITDLDPAFFEVYQSGGNLLTVIRGDSIGARDLIKKGIEFTRSQLPGFPKEFRDRYWSKPWQLYILQAYVFLFDFDNLPKAAEAFREAAMYPGAPDYIRHLDVRLKKIGGEYEVGIKLLGFMAYGAKDKVILERLNERKASLEISYQLFLLNHDFINHLKSRYPVVAAFQSGDILSKGIPLETLSLEFKRLTETGKVPPTDSLGGLLSLDERGRIRTSTEHEKVFGLD